MLDYFVGKICTILTFGTNFPGVDIKALANLFVGKVDSIDDNGIMVTSIVTHKKAYFSMNGFIGIIEEEVIPPDSPKVISKKPPSSTLTMDDLNKMLKESK